jgi:hypothetical protein
MVGDTVVTGAWSAPLRIGGNRSCQPERTWSQILCSSNSNAGHCPSGVP